MRENSVEDTNVFSQERIIELKTCSDPICRIITKPAERVNGACSQWNAELRRINSANTVEIG